MAQPPTIPELDVPKYLGRWYQMYASPVVMETFEENGVCVTATYGVYNASTLTVFNAMRLFEPTGEEDTLPGFAYTTEEPGKLWVELEGTGIQAPYWIMLLGPKTFGDDGLYEYAVVSDPTQLFLFVLARDVERFEAVYEDDMLEWLDENGWDSELNEPIKTYHDSTCLYPEQPSL